MATWRNRNTILQIEGFDELIKAVEKAERNVELETAHCFERCADILYDELYGKAAAAGLDSRLLGQIDDEMLEDYGIYRYRVGWKKQKPNYSGPLPDTYKVMFYNYGTPNGIRKTRAGYSRGQEPAHPIGSHGFIKKAKLAARRKVKKIQKDALKNILEDLPNER